MGIRRFAKKGRFLTFFGDFSHINADLGQQRKKGPQSSALPKIEGFLGFSYFPARRRTS